MRGSSVHTASLAGAACLVGLVVLQLAGTGTPRSAVLVGQDRDWDVKGWTPEHKINVEASRVDATSVHNIWHSKKQAWAGIDRILPTGGRFGYEEYHNENGNQAKLLNYVKHARHELKTIEAHLPVDRGARGQEENTIARTLDAERNGLLEVKREIESEKTVIDKARPQILAQRRPKPSARVYADNALFGEGIVGDIQSQGHHARKWSRKGAEKNMNAYFDRLNLKLHKPKAHGWHKRAGDEMDEYMHELDARDHSKAVFHDALLKQEGYYHTHPFEKK